MTSAPAIDTSATKARALYVFCVALFPVLLAGLFTLIVFVSGAVARDDGIGAVTEFAEFSHPRAGERIADQFDVQGVVKSIPAGKTVYFVEQSDGRIWPKQHLGSNPVAFKRGQFAKPGAGYKYTILLLAVDKAGQSQIEAWFEHGKQSGKYPGISDIAGSTTLARMRVIHQ